MCRDGRLRKGLLAALALAILLVIALHLEMKMMIQVQTLISSSLQQQQMVTSTTRLKQTERTRPNTESSSYHNMKISTNDKNIKNDWFQESKWKNGNFTQHCWHVENVCHSSHRWFYDPHQSSRPAYQPPFVFVAFEMNMTKEGLDHKEYSPAHFFGRPKKLIVQSPRRRANNHSNVTDHFQVDALIDNFTSSALFFKTCRYSPIPNHMVLQSYDNDVLGEFYTRSLVHIYAIYSGVSDQDVHTNTKEDEVHTNSHRKGSKRGISFEDQTQMYLHVQNIPKNNRLLDFHHVFTDAFRSNSMLSFSYLVDYTGCRCLKRLFFCGYDRVIPNMNQQSDTFADDPDRVTTELIPSFSSGPESILDDYPNVFSNLRGQLRNLIDRNLFIQQDIVTFRYQAILRYRPQLGAATSTLEQLSEVRIVCLSQLNRRRLWRNLEHLLRKCNTEWFNESDKIACIEVNLENREVNPVRQLVMHAACDMLFGIHGAHLAEAVWMKDGSVVVELLPWIPAEDGYGSWTRTTDVPTPLGVIFSECSLHHIGYRLPRESAPYCFAARELHELEKCFSSKVWDERDFLVNPDTLQDMIRKFAPRLASTESNIALPESCEEMLERSGDRVYVLYNVLCVFSNQTKGRAEDIQNSYQFYWTNDVNGT